VLKHCAFLSEEQLAVGSDEEAGGGAEPASPTGRQRLHCLASDLERGISQVIGDMELMVTVPNRWAVTWCGVAWQ
jgi:hypothetical protein